MKKRIIIAVMASLIAVACFAACTDKTVTETSEQTVAETSAVEQSQAADVSESVESSEASQTEGNAIPQPGDTYNGHTVDHTEDQPNCDDGSHGTIWVFYTDCDDVDYIEY